MAHRGKFYPRAWCRDLNPLEDMAYSHEWLPKRMTTYAAPTGTYFPWAYLPGIVSDEIVFDYNTATLFYRFPRLTNAFGECWFEAWMFIQRPHVQWSGTIKYFKGEIQHGDQPEAGTWVSPASFRSYGILHWEGTNISNNFNALKGFATLYEDMP